jgi:hypothetical protein
MKFVENFFLINGSVENTLKFEGGSTWIFAQNSLSKFEFDLSNKKYLEIGPKHGHHTRLIDMHQPQSITCIEAPNKFRSDEIYKSQNGSWVSKIKTEKFDFHYQDFITFSSIETYDLIFYSGIIYHNIDQIGHLKKLHSIASEGAFLLFESSTTREESLMDLNVIQVHHPPYSSLYRDMETIRFHPTKKACKSMLEICGWEIVDDTDNYENLSNRERIAILCRKSIPVRNRHIK